VPSFWKGNIPWITGADFSPSGIGEFRRYISDEAVRQTATNVIDGGELLLVTRTGVGKLAVAPCDIAISQDITGVYPDRDQVDVGFLFHRMRQGVEDLKKLNQGTSINGIVRKDLLQYKINLPPLPQQQRIAEILSTVDEAIEQTEALIAKTQAIKAGLMHDLFTRGVLPNGRLRPPREEAPELYKESVLGWIPVEWGVRPLNEIAEVNRGKFTIRPRNDPRYYNGHYPFIQTGDVAMASGQELTNYNQTLNERGLGVSRLFLTGTIMVTIAANIADTCILGIPMCAPDSLVGVAPNAGQVARYLELCIRRRKRWFENRAPQTAQKNINLDDLRPLLIPYPDPREQARIANRYETIEGQLRQDQETVVKFSDLKRGLMHDLLTGRVGVDMKESKESKT
jgi:type I restriction enzyme S subunit